MERVEDYAFVGSRARLPMKPVPRSTFRCWLRHRSSSTAPSLRRAMWVTRCRSMSSRRCTLTLGSSGVREGITTFRASGKRRFGILNKPKEEEAEQPAAQACTFDPAGVREADMRDVRTNGPMDLIKAAWGYLFNKLWGRYCSLFRTLICTLARLGWICQKCNKGVSTDEKTCPCNNGFPIHRLPPRSGPCDCQSAACSHLIEKHRCLAFGFPLALHRSVFLHLESVSCSLLVSRRQADGANQRVNQGVDKHQASVNAELIIVAVRRRSGLRH